MQEQYNRFSPLDATPPHGPSTKRAIRGGDPLGTKKEVATTSRVGDGSQGACKGSRRARKAAQDQGSGVVVDLSVGPSKWALRAESARLLPMWSVKDCMHKVVDGMGTVTGIHVPSTKSGVIVGVKRCKSVWVCPICASVITERRRLELQEALDLWRGKFGGRVVMCTYTFRHGLHTPLKWMVAQLNEAFRVMKKPGSYGRMLDRFGVAGSVAARENKHSMVNGHHPHIHELLFVPSTVDVALLEMELRAAWETAAAKCGLSMNQHGFSLDDCDRSAADYLAKFGHEAEWTEAEEISKWHLKRRGSATRQPEEHYTPFQLLRFSLEGDEEAGRLFVEYAQAFYGRAQMRWKPGFRETLGLVKERSDAELIEEHTEVGEVMVVLHATEEWPRITGNDAVGEFVQTLATGDMHLLCKFLGLLGIERDPEAVPYLIDMKQPKQGWHVPKIAVS